MPLSNNSGNGFAPESTEAELAPVITATYATPLAEFEIEKHEASEWGYKLPVGIFFNGERLQEFTLNPYKTKYDRQLGQLLNAPKVKLAQVLSQFMPLMINTIGGYELKDLAQKMSLSIPRLIESLYLADALTLVLAIRAHSQGTEIAMSAQCPNCGTQNTDDPKKGRPFHDLSSVEISVVKNADQKPLVEVVLEDGIEYLGYDAKVIYMRPLRLHQLDELSKSGGSNVPIDIALLYSMICAIPEVETLGGVESQMKRREIFSDDMYDELTMRDVKILRDAVEKLQPGPDMNSEMSCHQCGHDWKAALPWSSLRQFLFIPPSDQS